MKRPACHRAIGSHTKRSRGPRRERHGTTCKSLVNQPLGRGVAPTETVMRVADGNHWQWALTSSDVPENLMPASMFSGIPRESLVVAQYEALAEFGIVAGGER